MSSKYSTGYFCSNIKLSMFSLTYFSVKFSFRKIRSAGFVWEFNNFVISILNECRVHILIKSSKSITNYWVLLLQFYRRSKTKEVKNRAFWLFSGFLKLISMLEVTIRWSIGTGFTHQYVIYLCLASHVWMFPCLYMVFSCGVSASTNTF